MALFYQNASAPEAPAAKPAHRREAPSTPVLPASESRTDGDLAAIIVALQQLRSLPGYLREEVVSSLLKRFLPSKPPTDVELLKRLTDAVLCPRQIAYLPIAIRDENERVSLRATQSFASQRSSELPHYTRRSNDEKRSGA